MQITPRTLAPSEVQRAIDAGGPLSELQVSAEALKSMTIAVVEVDGAIAAYWVVSYALHVEPLWIAPRWRKHPGVVGGIVQQMQRVVEATEAPAAFCVIDDANAAEMAPYADRLGFVRAPGTLYYVVVQAAPPVKG